MSTPLIEEFAVGRYIQLVDASASDEDAADAIRRLFASARPFEDGTPRFLAHGIVLVLTDALGAVIDVHPALRPGERERPKTVREIRRLSRFVVVEGIDGSGMTTLINAMLAALGPEARLLRCNRDTEVGRAARNLTVADAPPYAVQAAMIADKFLLDVEIRGVREAGGTCLVDRWTYSAMAYNPPLRKWLAAPYAQLDVPSHVLLIDVPVETALARLCDRGKAEAYENRARLAEARRWYLEESRRGRWTLLDGTRPAAEVLTKAMAAIGG